LRYALLTDDEADMYNYLLAAPGRGEEEANEYLRLLDREVNKRLADKKAEEYDELTGTPLGAAAGTLATIPASLLTGFGYGKQYIEQMLGIYPDPNDPALEASRFVSSVRGNSAKMIRESFLGDLGAGVYNTVLGVADMLAGGGNAGDRAGVPADRLR
jgi:hypothetical protein